MNALFDISFGTTEDNHENQERIRNYSSVILFGDLDRRLTFYEKTRNKERDQRRTKKEEKRMHKIEKV